jgi:hypothetical protein
MQKLLFFAAAMTFSAAAFAQDNTGSMEQSTQSESSNSTTTTTTTTTSGSDSTSSDPFDNAGSAEMRAWEKSNESSTSTTSSSGFGVGFGRDNDDHEDDRPAWSKHRPSRPTPEQIDGTYKITASTGQFLCTVNLKASPFFDGYWAVTSSGCPELWKVSRWDFQGPSLVLTNSSGDVYASFWPRARDLWVGQSTASGQRLSLSR